LASAVAPVAFAWLLDRGATPIWIALLALTAVGVALSTLLGRVMPLAAARVTNAATEEPVPA
jgi:hypothetical protein